MKVIPERTTLGDYALFIRRDRVALLHGLRHIVVVLVGFDARNVGITLVFFLASVTSICN
jgi:hypothetical protein